MAEQNKLDKVNATLDRFAKLIEENAEQLRKDKEEFNRRLAEDKAEFDRQLAKDRAEWKKRFDSICDQVGGQGNNIGEITEAITVSDNILDLLNKFTDIHVEHFYFNIRKKYPAKTAEGIAIRKHHEVDGLADGDEVVVVIEAKTVLTEGRVRRFLDKLARFKIAYPDRADKDLYGAMTFIRIDDSAYRLAERYGLFLIKASPPDVELANAKGFKPIKIV